MFSTAMDKRAYPTDNFNYYVCLIIFNISIANKTFYKYY